METSLLSIFLTGLLTGGLTCLAAQGGLLASSIAQREQTKIENNTQSSGNALPIIFFLGSKLIAYTILGAMLGWLGSAMQLSLTAKVMLQAFVALYMLATAMNLLQIHPIFRYVILQPPKSLTRLIRRQSKSSDFSAPAILGAFTVFIPCGTTQAMMALAISSGNAMLGAIIMAVFVLGTTPLFFTLGYFATRLGGVMQKRFTITAALLLIFLSFYTFYTALVLTGVNFGTFSNNSTKSLPTVNHATITIDEKGYSPNIINVKAGSEITLDIENKDGWGCQMALVIPSLGFQKVIQPGKNESLTFTAPNKTGEIPFMCSMGMYRGVINVI